MASKLCILFMFSTLIIVSSSQFHRVYYPCGNILQPQNSRVEMRRRYYIVHCDPGYIVSGDSVVFCRDGQWETPPPTCVKNKKTVCPEADIPENGEIKCDEGPLYPGKVCRFHCSDGFALKGLNMRRCMWNHQWSGRQPSCVQETGIRCPVPPPLEHGTVIGCSKTIGPPVGKTCNFRCNTGYVLQGYRSVVCTSSGELKNFNGQNLMPKCVAINPSYCERYNPCQNNGLCIRSGETSYICRCQTGFTGKNCEIMRNPCWNNPCKNGGICKNPTVGKYECECVSNFSGAHCEKRECPPNLCHNGGTCIKNSLGFYCSCPRGFTGVFCQEKLWSYTPEANTNGNDHRTEDTTVLYNPGSHHPSKSPSQPENGEEQGGSTDNRDCSRNNGGCEQTCDHRHGQIQCKCRQGYILASNGRSCRRVAGTGGYNSYYHTCSLDNGGCEHTCDDRYGRIQCRCKNGYALARDQRSCHDIDECAYEGLNRCQYRCHNFEGGYNCSCPNGYQKINKYRCEGCKKNTYWAAENNDCVRCPDNSYTIAEGKTSIRDCLCHKGYVGKPGENIPCQDIDECAINNFGCSDKCVNTPGSAFCSCPLGYMLDMDEKSCIDIDECSIKNGGCEGGCVNNEGSFHCFCLEGYTISNKDHFSCNDIDECLENNGGCQQKCNNYPGGYYCSCEKGFRLDSGLENCTDIHCPAFTIPHYSRPKCKLNKKNFTVIESYPVGTVCSFKCSKGFKITSSSNSIICLNNGTWEGITPECKSEQCPPLLVPENGQVHPSSCSIEGAYVKQICTFTCNSGYRLVGKSVFSCKNNLTWAVKDIPVCHPIGIQPVIKCPEDISVDLLPGEDSQNITIPSPISNVEDLKIKPNWVSTDVPIKFFYGTTNIIFTASDTNSNRRTRCSMSVNILDKEPPMFDFCPKSFEVDGAGADGIVVTWEKPVVSDNVAVTSLQSNMEPNSTLMPGTYFVTYIATDGDGNSASCKFSINVTRIPCSDLENPINGKANCMHWIFGKMCRPLCDTGYTRHPNEAILHTCGDTGIWVPSESISDCLKYIPALSSTCPDQYELIDLKETGEEVCVECPKTTVWLASTKKCEETTY